MNTKVEGLEWKKLIMSDEKIKQMVLEIINFIDYDLFKELINDREVDKEDCDIIIECTNIVRKYI